MSDTPHPEESNPTGDELTIPASEPVGKPLRPPGEDPSLTLSDDTPAIKSASHSGTPQEQERLTPAASPKPVSGTDAFRKRVNFQDILISLGSGVVGGAIVLLLLFVARLMLQDAFKEMGTNIQFPVEVALVGALAFFVALGLGIWQRILGFVAALVSGLLIALVLFAFWQANGGTGTGTEVEGVNLLLYGFPGILTGIGLSALGGWVGMQVRIAFGAPAALSTPAKVGVAAIAVWVVGELAARITTVFTFPPAAQGTLLPLIIPLAIAYPLLTAVIVAMGYRGGIKKEDWHYRWSGVNLAIGSVVGVVLFAITFLLTRQLDANLFGVLATSATNQFENAITGTPDLWLRAAYIGVVGLLVPITEEWVWRGIIHTGLTKGMGQVTGFIITALAFVLKYLLVSLSIVNITTLLVMAIVLGLVRARVGTGASTVTHIITSLLTALIVIVT